MSKFSKPKSIKYVVITYVYADLGIWCTMNIQIKLVFKKSTDFKKIQEIPT